jgi:hypothetical protein
MDREIVNGLTMSLKYDDDNNLFILEYCEGFTSILQVRMQPENFEKLTHDMIRTIKNYNLYQAQQYQDKINGNARIGMDDTEKAINNVEGTPLQSQEIEQKSV